ncbi:acyl-CoA dehydrogenase family protein [Mycobacterium angelicum]|uniref:Acyl-CoA dehydrogenase n=1 Tax=Mycobacterium angelicum TaxID=470074 RepID=A0A1W9ZHA8_MYCAN|nr:acyl-CoA dehydrogenase family protein [Mycobacterium angelicum]MCV7199278.1 acyl-CoA dehydrogenase family protein [Mycobacterium angelicum]ORA14967.1 acyl-CoA dehydrogenase [Mycobacterium angelicum]
MIEETLQDVDLVERVRAVLPSIAARAAETESLRRVPVENVDELRAAGYLSALVPAKYGGQELSLTEVGTATRLLASACPSTAWAMGLLMLHCHPIANFSGELQHEIWGSGDEPLICSSVAPVGKTTRTKGGIRLSGRFSFSSGCEHASWAILGFSLPNANGDAEPHFAVVPRQDYSIEDVWFAMGLRGSGSQDLVVEDAFVPHHRYEKMWLLNTGQASGFATNPAPVYRLPFAPVNSLAFPAVVLGAAEALRDLYRDRIRTRVRSYTGAKVVESSSALMRLAESSHELDAAARILDGHWSEMDARSLSPDIAGMDQWVTWRTGQTYATRLAVRAADRLFEAAGGSAIRDDNPMQRYWRDIHTAASHAYCDYDVAAQMFGSYLAQVAPPAGVF